MRLIDAEALINEWNGLIKRMVRDSDGKVPVDFGLVIREVSKAPTIDAVEVVHGQWDDSGRYQFPNGRKAIRRNICGCALSESEYSLFNWNYCPVCGTKMDGERKDE